MSLTRQDTTGLRDSVMSLLKAGARTTYMNNTGGTKDEIKPYLSKGKRKIQILYLHYICFSLAAFISLSTAR